MLPSFEKPHRLSGLGRALLVHSLHLAVTHLFSRLFPGCPSKGGAESFPQSGREAGACQKLHSWDHSVHAWGRQAQSQVEIVLLQMQASSIGPTFFTQNILLVSLESNLTRARPS